MTEVKARRGESFESLWKRFKNAVDKSKVLSDFRKKERYEKPSIKRKKKQAAAKKRFLEQERRKKRNEYRNRPKGPSWQWNRNHTKKIFQKPRPVGSDNTKKSFHKRPRKARDVKK